jgi:copper chaperone CopZ
MRAAIIKDMTQLDVLYRYGVPPTEAAALAIARIREVYGVRRVAFDEAEKTVRVEYDATRLNEATIHQLLRRAGLDVVAKLPMFAAPEPPAPAAVAPAPAK